MAADGAEIVGQRAQPDPALHAVPTMIPTTIQPKATAEHTDPAFDARSEAMATPKPVLSFARQ